jgi:plasmid stabilization system protein ParE
VLRAPQAEDDWVELFDCSPENAARYSEAIGAYCATLTTFPHRGTPRDDNPARLAHHELSQARRDRGAVPRSAEHVI